MMSILVGWGKRYKLIETSAPEQKLHELRMKICSGCPFSKESKVLKFINGNAEKVTSLKCTKCKCPCDQKSWVMDESCPENYW